MNADPTPTSTNWAAELRDLVNRVFDPNELHELAFDFNLDYDAIAGDNKGRRIVELIQVLARQQRLPEFIARCQELRPKEDWQPLLAAAKHEPLSFAVEYAAPQTAVSASPSPLQNKNLLIGIAALALIVIVVLVVMNLGGSDSDSAFAGDEGLAMKLATLVENPQPQTQLFFTEGLSGWRASTSNAVVSDDTVQLGTQSVLVRDKTFAPGQAILIDFEMSEVSSSNPIVTFSLQNAENRADATRIISLQALTQPESAASENGETMAADQFARNTTLVPDESYTVVMGLDANGRFLASLFGFSTTTNEDANFIHIQPEEWANDAWWFHIETGGQGSVTLLGGWDFAFDSVK